MASFDNVPTTSNVNLKAAVSQFGKEAKAKLMNPVATGAPEDQLRAPLERLIADLAELCSIPRDQVTSVGESSLSDLKTRPDYAVTVGHALVGFIEVKAPGKGADPRRFKDGHDREQWDKLKSLPNLIYTDGNAFSLWHNGELDGEIVQLHGDVEKAGADLEAPSSLLWLFTGFFGWTPSPPRTAKQLAETSAHLCKLLRDEVSEQMAKKSAPLTRLAEDWRRLLFPKATDFEFADGYAQAVTFGLLVARARQIPLSDGLEDVARELSRSNSLIGTALRLLTDNAENQATLKTSLETLTRVLDVVDWKKISKGDPDAWLYFYEDFLAVYDNDLRKLTGSYYTPPPVVREMVRLVDDVLQSRQRFGLSDGFASPRVTVADPAVGTGTFLLGVLRRIAATVEADEGAGAVAGKIHEAARRLIGFELQFGPFAVAQLRLLAEFVDLMTTEDAVGQATPPATPPDLRLFVADTLSNPFAGEEDWIPAMLQPLAESRKQANAIKRREAITVVIGNPPYREKAMGWGGWIEAGDPTREAPLSTWMPPPEWNAGVYSRHLRNLYVYFWRWATWKVFGAGRDPDEGAPPNHAGVVCFITAAGFLNGAGFQKMRADLRRDANEIWVIDCSPEGHQPPISTRVFEGVQQPICIVLAARTRTNDSATPAHVRFYALPEGHRKGKFEALAALTLDNGMWEDCPTEWRASFLPTATGDWATFPKLGSLFVYDGTGVMPGRTWVIAPDTETLRARWRRLSTEPNPDRKEALFHPHLRRGKPGDKHSRKETAGGLAGHEHRPVAVADDSGEVVEPVRYAFRSFDRQWIIPDSRLINQANPTLWEGHSEEQVYLTAPTDKSPTVGPALTFSDLIPDVHHYNGRGGRAFPLWLDAASEVPNVNPNFLAFLSETYGIAVLADDVMAYLATVAAHPAYTTRFQDDLVRPGLRIPITGDAELFAESVALGREIIWLHTFGERFVEPQENRPARPPRVSSGNAPTIPAGGAIPTSPEAMPDELHYDSETRRLHVGGGYIENVDPAVWAYEVSGKQVLTQWFSYRRADRSRPIIGNRRPPSDLNAIQADHWLAEYTSELLNVLHVLTRLVALEPAQADLLDRICTGTLLNAEELSAAGAFSPPEAQGRRAGRVDPDQKSLF